ncbi:hypothetical protein IFU39_17010 [Paenibacillus sp. CFBP 13594]|uniref:hypothetical protein n=1 Tax=Paenibacillus sp. CFBP 13594 TaxID=2774037 RepID=UPI00177B0533|nr:hypothetical protein [Paenibacillus sp. CFBP 13594]MBD8839514.1 hypothetical protein [Paenibacillus sp. CFBP 13594]
MSTKEIGLPIDLTLGVHNGTEIKDGKLQLKEIAIDSTGKSIYAAKGTWESSVISIGDKVTAFQRVVKTMVGIGSNVDYKIFTRSSTDNITWSEYAEITYVDGKINSPVGLYAKVMIELSSTLTPALLTVDEFTDGKYNTGYVSSSDGTLRLKRNITLSPTVLAHEDGFLYRTKFERNKLSKINGITFQ